MYPGQTTRLTESLVASSTSISPVTDLVNLSGSTAIETISPPYIGFSGVMILVPKDGTLGLLTTGNILVAVTMPQNRATVLVWSDLYSAWAPGAIS